MQNMHKCSFEYKMHAKITKQIVPKIIYGKFLIRLMCINVSTTQFHSIWTSDLYFKIPLCEPESEKSGLEEKMIWSKLLCGTIDSLTQNGFDMEETQREANATLKEAMIKLFAVRFFLF